MTIVCPHCNSAVDVAGISETREVMCTSCGSSFGLEVTSTLVASAGGTLGRFGKFQLLSILGMGAYGTVYKARDPQLERIVAVKVPRAGSSAKTDQVDRFLREARSAAQLSHPNIVPIHEVGQTDTLPYMVSAFVQG